jgi:obg-like ATPase 1
MVNKMKDELNLISFYTMGEKEAREWNIKRLSTAPEGAGLIHTDLQNNFINVNVLKYDKLMESKDQIKEIKDIEKLVKSEKHGKDYLLEDGDVVLFKSVGGKTR